MVILNNTTCEFCQEADGQFIALSRGRVGREIYACKNCILHDKNCEEFIVADALTDVAKDKSKHGEIRLQNSGKDVTKMAKETKANTNVTKNPAKEKKVATPTVAKNTIAAQFEVNKETGNCYRLGATRKNSAIFGSLYILKDNLPEGAIGATVTILFDEVK